MKAKRRKHEWCDVFCEKCDSAWGVCVREDDGAYAVIETIRKTHARNHPECHKKYEAGYVRICTPEGRCPQVERMRQA